MKKRRTVSEEESFSILTHYKGSEVIKGNSDPFEKSLLSHWEVLWLSHLVPVNRTHDTT